MILINSTSVLFACSVGLMTSVLFACSVGLMTIRYPEMMLKPEVKKLYFEWLARDSDPSKKMQVKITSEYLSSI